MSEAKLTIPCLKYLISYLEACREFKHSGEILDGLPHDPDDFNKWEKTIFAKFEQERLGLGLPDGYVPSSTFWLVDGGKFIGAGNLRHCLTPALERFGGHIGYSIRPSKWNRGYGTIQLSLLLREASKLGISQVLVTCDEGNTGSYRVIKKSGGIYQDTIDNIIDNKLRRTKRYWIDTSPKTRTDN